MLLLRRIFEFYINSHMHVAIAICSLVLVTYLTFDLPANTDLLGFVFFGAISGYNFIKYFGIARFHHRRLAPWLRHIQIFALIAFMGLVFFALRLSIYTLLLFLSMGLITFFYTIPFLPKKMLLYKGTNLRGISGIKIYVVALVWTAVTVVIPMEDCGYAISNDVIIQAFQIFLYVIVATLPFEIRDLQYDSLKLATIPQQIGLGATKAAGTALIFLIIGMELFKDELEIGKTVVLVLVMLISLLFLLFSKKNQIQYYSSFWVEAIPIVWLLLIWGIN
ncbi:MAG: hypothetical protein HKO90_05530 [Flavobacteriaceae bacterium]|nr:hypothetical protein [Bacteroidia bacterium]NNK87722.1 hypothetical protein [Flavobacteriaceae bacterium]